jgi:molecular chaperone GrpE
MSDNDNNSSNPSPETHADAASSQAEAPTTPQASAPAGSSEAPANDPPAAPDVVATLTAERDKFRDQLLRAVADFDNYRKRSKRDEQEAVRRGKEDLLRELLPVFDNLERASESARVATDPKAIAEGVSMVTRLFSDTLARLGGKRVNSVGTPFDPNLHEAVGQEESAEHPAGTVMREFVPGYQFGERLLRPAMVVVSRGAPAPSSNESGN